MDISVKNWEPGKSYKKDDIVKLGNIAAYGEFPLRIRVDSGPKMLTDSEDYILAEGGKGGGSFERIEITQNSELEFGDMFPVNSRLGYSARCMVKKLTEDSETIRPYTNNIIYKDGAIDVDNSSGIGVGVRFYNKDFEEVRSDNFRETIRIIGSSEINDYEFYNAQVDIEPKKVPTSARMGSLFIFSFGIQKGGFVFDQMEVGNLSPFFYCKEKHVSEILKIPNDADSQYWTQDFLWRPSYGSTSNFRVEGEKLNMGEGSDYINNQSINAIPLVLNASFNNRTDSEAKAIIHFLQEKSFSSESMFAINHKGDRLNSSAIGDFNFIYTHPYRKDLKFSCTDFTHSIVYRNNNNLSASFICNTESSLRSVESNSGYNPTLDALVPIFINEETKFIKGQKTMLSTFEMDESAYTKLTSLYQIRFRDKDESGKPLSGVLEFKEPQDLEVGDCIFLRIDGALDSIYSVGKTNIKKIINEKMFVFGPVSRDGLVDDLTNHKYILGDDESRISTDNEEDIVLIDESKEIDAEIRLLHKCPEECLSSQPLLPAGVDVISCKIKNPHTGNIKKRIAFLKNYRKLEIETDISREVFSIYVTPTSTFTLQQGEHFRILLPAVRGRSSIYIESPDDIEKYPWLKVRDFEHNPTLSFQLSSQPAHIDTEFTKNYNKKYKKQINQNMSSFEIVLDQRDDVETAEILQFLESHLGYKKFRFTMPRPYGTDSDSSTTQSRPFSSIFYCPEWSHSTTYKNNHKITAKFIESATSIYEDMMDIAEPCYGAEIISPIVKHSLCTFSSVAFSYHQSGLTRQGEDYIIEPKSKREFDLIFVVEAGEGVTSSYVQVGGVNKSRFDLVIDSILKSIVGYDLDQFPGTNDYGSLDAPEISTSDDANADESVPPWYNKKDEEGVVSNLLIDNYVDDTGLDQDLKNALKDKGYNIENFKRFNCEIEQNKINVGICFVGDSSILDYRMEEEVEETLILPDYPKSFDKISMYESIKNHEKNNFLGKSDVESICSALAQFYNSPRANKVNNRIIYWISDFSQKSEDIVPLEEIAKSLRRSGELSKRRPLDEELKKHGMGINEHIKLYGFTKSWKTVDGNANKFYSNIFNPDFEGDFKEENEDGLENKEWYNEEVETSLIPISLQDGVEFEKYCKDYSSDKSFKNLEMHHVVDDPSDGGSFGNRILEIPDITKKLTSDSGFDNLISVTINNCGPNPIRIHNTIVSVDTEPSFAKWHTETIPAGIPKNNDHENFEHLTPTEYKGNTKSGHGGQFYGDPRNKKFLNNQKSENLLWHSFNTKYEIYSNGKVKEVDGGWGSAKTTYEIKSDDGDNLISDFNEKLISDEEVTGPIRTDGILNAGVAFKDFPVRVFKTQKGVEIIDYNIANASEKNEYKGDYSHLPELKKNESIDLFFGIRHDDLENIEENVQLFFNIEDMEDKHMDCYTDFKFKIKINKEEKETQLPKIKMLQKPGIGPGCRVMFSGALIGSPAEHRKWHTYPAFAQVEFAEILGGDEFTSDSLAALTPKATASTFDSIMIDTTTRIKIYQGDKVFFDGIGPFVLNNAKWGFSPNYDRGAGNYKDQDGNEVDNFWNLFGITKDNKHRSFYFSESDMHGWPAQKVEIWCLDASFNRNEEGDLLAMPDDYCYDQNGNPTACKLVIGDTTKVLDDDEWKNAKITNVANGQATYELTEDATMTGSIPEAKRGAEVGSIKWAQGEVRYGMVRVR